MIAAGIMCWGVMRVVLAAAPACVLSLFLAQCGFFADPNAWPQKFHLGDAKTLAMGADIRLVTERERDMPGAPPLRTLCTEPSPDVAIAFGRSLAAQGSYSEPNGPNASGSLNLTSTETATELAGRTAGVLALRDGLYAACEAYNNGVLGQNAYAMVLSQYGNLLVALAAPGPAGSSTGSTGSTGDGKAGGSNPALFTPKDSVMAALLVSCISEYDPTRLGAGRGDGRPATNRILTPAFCKQFLANVTRGNLLPVPKAAAVAPQPSKPKTAQAATATQSVMIKVTGPSSAGASGAITPSADTSTKPTSTKTSTDASSSPASTQMPDKK